MRKGELTKQRIIELSAPVFNQKGFAGAAVSDLMRATGMEKGGIYRHFESKQELAESAFDYAWRLAFETRFEGAGEIPDAVDRLIHVVRSFRDRRAGLVPGGCPLLNTAIESDDGNPPLRAKARRALNEWLDRLQSIIREGKRQGQVRAGVDEADLASLIVGTLEGSLMMNRLQRSGAPIDSACRHLESYLEQGVRAHKAKAGRR